MLCRLLAAVTISFLFIAQVQAQTSGAIIGSVNDPSGGAISGATVSVTEVNKGTTQIVKTDAAGSYSAPFLTPGTYQVSVEAPGFKKATSQKIILEVDARQPVDFKIEVGNVSEAIEVTAAAPL